MSEVPAAMELVDGLKEEEEDVQPGGEEHTNGDRTDGQEEGDAEAAAEADATAEGEGDADDAAASEEQLAEEAQLRRDKEQANKKKVRHTLRTLDGITSDDKIVTQLLDPNLKVFGRYVDTLNKIHDKIGDKDVTASLADADILKRLGGYGVQQARQLTAVRQKSLEEVLRSFCNLYPADPESSRQNGESSGINWRAFGRRVAASFATVTPTSFMKGVLGVQCLPKEKKKRAARRAAAEEEDEEGEETAAGRKGAAAPSEEAATMTDKRVTLLYDALPKVPTNLFEVLFHPRDFTQTVENLFDLTFLVKKGHAAVELDPELGIPTVRKVDEDSAGAGGADEGDEELPSERQNFQCIFKLDMATYKELVQAFHIDKRGEPFIRDRSMANGAEMAAGAAGARGRKKGAAAAAAASAGSSAAGPRSGAKRSRNAAANGAGEPSALERIPAFFSPSQQTIAHAFSRRSHSGDDSDSPPPSAAAAASPHKRQRRSEQHNDEEKSSQMSGEE